MSSATSRISRPAIERKNRKFDACEPRGRRYGVRRKKLL
jgi:hypothetical protein